MVNIKQDGKNLLISFKYDMGKVEKVKSLPKRKYDVKNKQWIVPAEHINLVMGVFKEYQVSIDTNLKINTLQKPKHVELKNCNFKTKPYSYQLEGVKYGLEHDKFLLGDQQGLGKTKQAIDIAVARKGQFKHCLIVCGVNSLKWNWLEEIKIHSNEKGHLLGSRYKKNKQLKDGSVKDRLVDLQNIDKIKDFFLVTNIETLRNKDIQEELKKLTESGIIGMVVIDEAHKAKNSQVQQGKAIHKLNSMYKIAITGTPLINKPEDLYNILKWLNEEHGSFYRFKNRYCVMGGYGGYEVVAYKNLAELQTRVDKIMLRRLKNDVLDLPEKIYTTEYVEMGVKQTKVYKEVMQSLKSNLDLIKVSPNPLAQLIRLRQATGYTGILSSSIKESAKFERLKELVEQCVANDEKVIVFSNWTEMTNPARELLKEYNPAVITGQTRDNDRMAQVNKFQTDGSCKVIIGTIGAMGTGLTLTAANTVIFLDSPWSKAIKEQAEDRAHRIGTKGSVNIITLVCKDTIDERIEEIIRKKGKLSDALIDGECVLQNKQEMVNFLLS